MWLRQNIGPQEGFSALKAHLARDFDNLDELLQAILAALPSDDPFEAGAFGGPPSDRTIGTGLTVLNNYPISSSVGGVVADAAAGTITLNSAGLYQITGYVYGDQGNNLKEEDMFLGLRSSVQGDQDLWNFMVATDKTQARAFQFNVLRQCGAGEVLSQYMYATADLGTFSFEASQLRAERLGD